MLITLASGSAAGVVVARAVGFPPTPAPIGANPDHARQPSITAIAAATGSAAAGK
ncbi:hypothetical protein D7316_04829 [Gordonia insulae]|uniref:Uncharacterized protein n=1 Tax=Gordonia insulae TaxID=2420509 RepID=A0A3G8JUL7_9ACTN|nr:hypothetical protein D7316_04829 [Gordonia insulae]